MIKPSIYVVVRSTKTVDETYMVTSNLNKTEEEMKTMIKDNPEFLNDLDLDMLFIDDAILEETKPIFIGFRKTHWSKCEG